MLPCAYEEDTKAKQTDGTMGIQMQIGFFIVKTKHFYQFENVHMHQRAGRGV